MERYIKSEPNEQPIKGNMHLLNCSIIVPFRLMRARKVPNTILLRKMAVFRSREGLKQYWPCCIRRNAKKKLAAMDGGVRSAFIDTATGRIAIGLKLMWPSHNANLFIHSWSIWDVARVDEVPSSLLPFSFQLDRLSPPSYWIGKLLLSAIFHNLVVQEALQEILPGLLGSDQPCADVFSIFQTTYDDVL